MVRCSVGIGYFLFFLGADFPLPGAGFAAAFFATGFAAFLAGTFFAGTFFAATFFAAGFAAFGAAFFASRFGFASSRSVSAIGASSCPRAAPSINTTSDQRRWYVETSEYGITCTVGRLRPLKNRFVFTPFVRMSTF